MKPLRWAAALSLATLMGACVFGSERPLFADDEAAFPFPDGYVAALVEVSVSSGASEDAESVIYRRVGRRYEIAEANPSSTDEPLGAMFVAISDTPEEDYVIQMTQFEPDEESTIYAFMWRTDGGYRILSAPQAVGEAGEAAIATHCHSENASFGECHFATREDVMNFYREAVHPFAVSGETPTHYVDQSPSSAP